MKLMRLMIALRCGVGGTQPTNPGASLIALAGSIRAVSTDGPDPGREWTREDARVLRRRWWLATGVASLYVSGALKAGREHRSAATTAHSARPVPVAPA